MKQPSIRLPKTRYILILVPFLLGTAAIHGVGPYRVDTEASEIRFTASQLGLSRVEGRFERFTAQIQFDPENPASFSASAIIQVASIDTGNGTRDRNLRGGSFFDQSEHPEIRFRTTDVSANGPGRLRVFGDLTIRGVKKRTELSVNWTENPDKSVRFVATGKINRKDFGVSGGGFLIGNTIDLALRVVARPQS